MYSVRLKPPLPPQSPCLPAIVGHLTVACLEMTLILFFATIEYGDPSSGNNGHQSYFRLRSLRPLRLNKTSLYGISTRAFFYLRLYAVRCGRHLPLKLQIIANICGLLI